MRERKRWGALSIALSVTVATTAVAVGSALAVRQILRRDLEDAAEAQTFIQLARLRAAADSLGGHARGFLLTGSPTSFDLLGKDRDAFFGMLERLSRAPGDRGQTLAEVRQAATIYDRALESVIALRRRGEPDEVVVRAFAETIRPRRDELDTALGRLIDTEEGHLKSLDRSTERAAARLATAGAAVATGSLLVAVALALLLARAFRSLGRKQQELEGALERARKANDDLDAFAGRIAHDLRTPLSPILLTADRLRRHPDEQVVRASERITRCLGAATRLLDDLLAFSRLGRREESSAAAAADLVRATLDDFAEQIAAAGVAVETALDDEAIVACSAPLFRQVVSNLVGNAIKFLDGREQPRLWIELRASGVGWRLTVKDNGPGIPPEAVVHVFDRFYRVTGVKAAGNGLGLAIVRRIVEAHEGSVTVESSRPGGSTFHVVLPAGRAAATTGEARAPFSARLGAGAEARLGPGLAERAEAGR
jgi:signal transduction histidine kinase